MRTRFFRRPVYCNFLARYKTFLLVDVGEAEEGNQKSVTVHFHVEFKNPTSVRRHQVVPHDHVPAHPSNVGHVPLARLTYYMDNQGEWTYHVITQTSKQAVDFKRKIERNRVHETWTFKFKIPKNFTWDNFRGEFALHPAYEREFSCAECGYYSSANIIVYNDEHGPNPNACKECTHWEPTNTELPEAMYEYKMLNPGDDIGMRYPAKVKDVLIAPPVHAIPYKHGVDYECCFRNNMVHLHFYEPGIYTVKAKLFGGGGDTRFFVVGAKLAPTVYPFGRMVQVQTPGHDPGFAYSNDFDLMQFGVVPDMRHASTPDIIVNDLNGSTSEHPVSMFLWGEGDAGFVNFDDDQDWFMDGACEPSLGVKKLVAAGHGVLRVLNIFNSGVAKGLNSSCHLMKYIASALMIESPYNPYGSPYRPPLDFATVNAFDVPVAVVQAGTVRPGYFCHSIFGSMQSYTAYTGSGLTALAVGRSSTKEKPNFYNLK